MKSQAHKYFNKFTGWAQYAPGVRNEEFTALHEFFVNPQRIPEDNVILAMALFKDWFLFDRKLTSRNLTPLELFIESHVKKLKSQELAIYEEFLKTNRFGIFRLEDLRSGSWMRLKAMPDGDTFRVVEELGSNQAEKGMYFITRLVSFDDHWSMSGFVSVLPDEARYTMDREFNNKKTKLNSETIRPRQLLFLFMPKVQWEQEGIPRIKAKLASFLERWHVRDITVGQIESEIETALKNDQDYPPPIVERLLRVAPSLSDAEDVAEVLNALWNLMIPRHKPFIDEKMCQKGPMEKRLIHDLMRLVGASVDQKNIEELEKVQEESKKISARWLDTPQKELDGETPRKKILEERRALGNPESEIGYQVIPRKIEVGSQENEGSALSREARGHLAKGRANQAIECYVRAYPLLKNHPELFRLFGNWATAYIMLGDRERALEMLRSAIRVNPDYKIARNNLHLLETMGPEEFAIKYKEGFFTKINNVNEDTGQEKIIKLRVS